jgi:2-(1,2-epoxy-1,2-dihydrophenyl)acetyl-CoA isomerase
MAERVLLEIEPRIAWLTFNRPSRLNAIDVGMVREFHRAVDDVAARGDVRVLVLRGAGPAFMAGGDVETFAGDRERAVAAIGELIDHFHVVTLALQRLPAVVVASVHGAAAGGGFSLALGADLRIAADTASFTPAYLRLGTSPDGGGTFFLTRLVGAARALEMFLTGVSYSAADAARLGIVNRVVPAADLAAETRTLAERIAAGPSPAVAQTRRLIMRCDVDALERQLQAEKTAFLECVRSPDFAEGVAAFLDKRAPRFGSG